MSAAVEAFICRLYTDTELCRRFIADPHAVLATTDLTPEERASVADLDVASLRLANRFVVRRLTTMQHRGELAEGFVDDTEDE
jgi:hypothetical protein